MTGPAICFVCGFPAERHTVEILDGIAHAVVRGADGRHAVLCSIEAGCHQGVESERRRLRTIVRSLRNRSGRAWKRGDEAEGAAFYRYAQFIEREWKRLGEHNARWYERLNRTFQAARKEYER